MYIELTHEGIDGKEYKFYIDPKFIRLHCDYRILTTDLIVVPCKETLREITEKIASVSSKRKIKQLG